jgi:phage baseplate assembly protein W
MVTNEERLGKDVMMDMGITDDILISSQSDFKIATGNINLGQAIINRLRTGVGELELHPNYGCRLNTLIGTVANDFTLALARQHIREALLQEPRIKSINKITAGFTDGLRNIIQCEIQITPIESEQPLNIIYPFFITGET